ncbi:MAG TPA: flagellar export chaperone FliS, partial [Vicinamibacterales bacterium]
MVRGTRGADAYRRMEAESRSPMELVVMLYDGAIRFVGEAREAIVRKDVPARTEATRRALDIVSELQLSLNVKDGGEIARELDRLYSYMSTRLLDVTRGDADAADEIHKLLGTLRDGFSQAASPGAPAS